MVRFLEKERGDNKPNIMCVGVYGIMKRKSAELFVARLAMVIYKSSLNRDNGGFYYISKSKTPRITRYS